MGRDERVDHDGYADQDPAAVARQLVDAADLFANVLDRLAARRLGPGASSTATRRRRRSAEPAVGRRAHRARADPPPPRHRRSGRSGLGDLTAGHPQRPAHRAPPPSSWRSWVTSSTRALEAPRRPAPAARWPAGRGGWWARRAPGSWCPGPGAAASVARVRSPGDSDAAGRATWSAPSPNLASSVRASVTPPGTRPARRRRRRRRAAAPTTPARPAPGRSRRPRTPGPR